MAEFIGCALHIGTSVWVALAILTDFVFLTAFVGTGEGALASATEFSSPTTDRVARIVDAFAVEVTDFARRTRLARGKAACGDTDVGFFVTDLRGSTLGIEVTSTEN